MQDAPQPRLRFVVLYHDGVPEPHFDLMIESVPHGPLYTWRTPKNPLEVYLTFGPRTPNHRREYLEFEGPIAGGRGRVSRVAAGTGSFRLVRPRTWLWDTGGAGTYATYWMAPAPGGRYWVIEGNTHHPATGDRPNNAFR